MHEDPSTPPTASIEDRLRTANARRDAGALAEALALYAEVLAAAPGSAPAHGHMGIARFLGGEPLAAIECYRRALALEPGSAQVHINLGLALQAVGRLEEAIAAFRRAASLAPDNPRAHYNLGSALEAAGAPEEAVGALSRAVALDAGYAKALNNLGAALLGLGRVGEAIEVLRRAVAADPGSAEAHRNLGLSLAARGSFEAALKSLERAIALDPDFFDALVSLADVLIASGHPDRAIESLRRAVEVEPDALPVLGKLSLLLEESTRTEEAGEVVKRGLRLAPRDPVLSLVAARLDWRSERFAPAIERLEAIAPTVEDPDLAGTLRMELGQLYDRSGDAERAYRSISDGNALRASAHPDVDKDEFLVKPALLLEQMLSAPRPASRPEGACPAFLLGFPRSGSTLLDQILDAHPALVTLEEKPIVAALANGILSRPERYPRGIAGLPPAEIQRLRNGYFEAVAEFLGDTAGKTVIDKLPLNVFWLPLILRIFPEAKLLLCVRHPYDVCLSCYMQNFAVNSAMANFFTLESSAAFYVKAMEVWRRVCEAMAPQYHLVRYEALIEDLEREVRLALDFLGVGWSEEVLDYENRARSRARINTPSYRQVTQPIYTHARYRWKRYARHLEPVRELLNPYVAYFGY